MHLLQVSAFCLTVLGSAGAFGKSKIVNSRDKSGLYVGFLYEVSGLGGFADP